MSWLQYSVLPSTATSSFTCNLLALPSSTKHSPAYHSWLSLMFLSVLFCTLCFLDPNSRSMPASTTLYHLLPACFILWYTAVFPSLLIQDKSLNPYSHLLHFGSSYKLPPLIFCLFLQRPWMHFLKHEMAQCGYLDLWLTEYQRKKRQLAFQMCSPKLVMLLMSFWRKSQTDS